MENNIYMLTAYNTNDGTKYSLIDNEGKLTEPRFFPWTPGFIDHIDAKKMAKSISKTRSRVKQRLEKAFGECEVVYSRLVSVDEAKSYTDYVDASRRFGSGSDVAEMLSAFTQQTIDTVENEEMVQANRVWNQFVDEAKMLDNKRDTFRPDADVKRKVGYLLRVNISKDDELFKQYYIGRYNGISTSPEYLASHTWGYPDCAYFTGKIVNTIRGWIPMFRKYGDKLNASMDLSVVEVEYPDEGGCEVYENTDCKKWYK